MVPRGAGELRSPAPRFAIQDIGQSAQPMIERFFERVLSSFGRAKVAELVDARDLGSRGLVPWGFESPLSHRDDLVDFWEIP